jgi:glycosyltransferase involved in cell wall biosynthesis
MAININKKQQKIEKSKKKRSTHSKELELKKQTLWQQAQREVEIEKITSDQVMLSEMKEQIRTEPKYVNRNLNMLYSFVADKNGAGYYRTIWPMEIAQTYMQKNFGIWQTYIYEPSALAIAKVIRFQRQCTDNQKQAFDFYQRMRQVEGVNYKIVYELDDALNDIEPYNEVAYKFYDDKLKNNAIDMMKRSDVVTFSTDYLKKLYVDKYGLNPDQVKVIKNYIPQFMWNLPSKGGFDLKGRKPRVLWWGSASHTFKGGDMTFLIDMIRKTKDEYDWVFVGCIPSELEDLKASKEIEVHPWVPIYALANYLYYNVRADICLAPIKDNTFNKCKSDLKLVEGAALGIPVITSAFKDSPYNEHSLLNIENNADAWKATIDYVIGDSEEYMKIVQQQYTTIRNNRWLEYNIGEWGKLWDDDFYEGAPKIVNRYGTPFTETPIVNANQQPFNKKPTLDIIEPTGPSLQEIVEPTGPSLQEIVEPTGPSLQEIVEKTVKPSVQ